MLGNPHVRFDERDVEPGAMVGPLRHRQTKEAETDMPGLPPPRHIPTLPAVPILGQRARDRCNHPEYPWLQGLWARLSGARQWAEAAGRGGGHRRAPQLDRDTAGTRPDPGGGGRRIVWRVYDALRFLALWRAVFDR